MPLSPRPMRRFGYRSSTPAPMIAATMLIRFIWKPATLVNCALRRRSPLRFPRTLAGIARTAHALLAVFIKAGLGHLVEAVVLAGYELAPDRADAAHQPRIDAGFGRPALPVGTILDIGHAVPLFPICLRDEQFRREPG